MPELFVLQAEVILSELSALTKSVLSAVESCGVPGLTQLEGS